MINLRPYQTEAIDAIESAVSRGIQRPLVALPTGTGKTVLFAELIKRRKGRSLVLAHRDELLRQAGDKIENLMPGADIGYVKAEEDDHNKPIVIASVQTLSRQNRLDRLWNDYETIVVDEAHHAAAETYQRIIKHLSGFEKEGPIVLGVTATPGRGDKIGLDCVFEEIVYQKTILDMIKAQYLVTLRAIQVKLAVDFNRLHTSRGDFVDSEVEKMLVEANAPEQILEAFTEHAKDRKAILFTPTVKLAHEIAARFVEAGYSAEALDGTTPIDERRALLKRLNTGATQIVCNCGVLTEGFDEPSVDCIVVARPTQSRTLYVQMIGRGTRTWFNKKDCLILDLVGASSRHDLQTAAALFGVPSDALTKKTLTEYLAEKEAAEIEAQRLQGELVSQEVDLFQRSDLHWLRSIEGRFVLSATDGQLIVREDTRGWTVEHKGKGFCNTLIQHLSLEYALGFAEDEAREMGAEALVNKNAKWRKLPISEKQIETLTKFKIAIDPKMTKGEASDLISLAIAGFK
jgi:superfamily II DNA or RNA helicase